MGYRCYHCNKRVSIETLADLPDVICQECKDGFVESIVAANPPPQAMPSRTPDRIDEPSFSNQVLQVVRLIVQAAREEDTPPSEHVDPADDDSLRSELDGWDNDDDDEGNEGEVRNEGEDEEEEENNQDRSDGENEDKGNLDERDEEDTPPSEHIDPADDDSLRSELDGWDNDDDDEGNEGEVRNEGEDEEEEENNQDRSDGEIEDKGNRDERDEEDMRRRRSDELRLRLRRGLLELATGVANGQNRIPEWAETLMRLADRSIELRVQVYEVDDYVGNPEDDVDEAPDNGGRRGAPPAAKSAVMALQTMEITPGNGSLVCAICKDSVNVGEMAKKLPCGHGYHEDCIVPWLGSRNSCPVCRFELETDDPEYEEERKKRATANLGSGPSSSAG